MLFVSKNEAGEPAWKLVMEGRKTVTRRLRPQPVGAIRAVQPGRGKKAIGYIRIISCVKNSNWETTNIEEEVKKEGFNHWAGLSDWFFKNKIDINKTWRIEFELLPPMLALSFIPVEVICQR